MATQEELIGELTYMTPQALWDRLSDPTNRANLASLDAAVNADGALIAATIAAVPSSVCATSPNLEKTFDTLIRPWHPKVVKAIAEKIEGFTLDEALANPWLRTFAERQRDNQIAKAVEDNAGRDFSTRVGAHLHDIGLRAQARKFFGSEIRDMSQGSLQAEIRMMDPVILADKLADPISRRQLYDLNIYDTTEFDLVGNALERIPADVLAGRTDFQDIITGLLVEGESRQGTVEAIADKIREFSIEQINANRSWIHELVRSQKVKAIDGSKEPLDRISEHLQNVMVFNDASAFVGRPVPGISFTDISRAINEMPTAELVSALGDTQRRKALLATDVNILATGELVTHTIMNVRPGDWPKTPELTETFSGLMNGNANVVAAVVTQIERLPDETVLAQEGEDWTERNGLMDWAESKEVTDVVGKEGRNPAMDEVYKAVAGARVRAADVSPQRLPSSTPTLGDR